MTDAAKTLRRAASLMRERATHPEVSESPWFASPHGDIHDDGALWVADAQSGDTAEHIASWHPAVALAVADWLDSVARTDLGRSQAETHEFCDIDCDVTRALAVANAYLGEETG